MRDIKDLREQRAKLVKDAQALLEGDELTAETEQQFDAMMDKADTLKTEIDRLERLEDANASLAERVERRAGREDISGDEALQRTEHENDAFMAYLRCGLGGMTDEQRAIAAGRIGPVDGIRAAQSVGTDSAGGYTVPEGFRAILEEAMLAFGGMREAAFVFSTASGNDLPMPTENDTSNEGEIIGENTQVNEQDVVFAQAMLNAYMYSSKLVRVSYQLLQDSAFDMPSFLARTLGTRIARITNRHFTVGTGTAQPNGVVTAAPVGKTGAGGQTTSIIHDDLIDLEHSVDPAYRTGARFMFHDSTLKALKKLKDGDNRPLWSPGIAVREPDTITSYPYTINQHMPVMAANAKSVLFGDFSKYMIRDVLGVQVLRLNERYADYLQVGFMAYSRHDGELLDAGTNPIKHYANAAT